MPVAGGILEYLDRVAPLLVGRGRIRILQRARNPETAALVECDVHWLADVGAGGGQFHLEAVGNGFQALRRRERVSLTHQCVEVRPAIGISGKCLPQAKRHPDQQQNKNSEH